MYGKEITRKCYEHDPYTVTEIGTVTILLASKIHKDRKIKSNCTGIVIKNHKNRTRFLLTWLSLKIVQYLLRSLKIDQNTRIFKWISLNVAQGYSVIVTVCGAYIIIKGMILRKCMQITVSQVSSTSKLFRISLH